MTRGISYAEINWIPSHTYISH